LSNGRELAWASGVTKRESDPGSTEKFSDPVRPDTNRRRESMQNT